MKSGVVLVDLNGTLHTDDRELPGAINGLTKLRRLSNVEVKFISNTTKMSKQSIINQLRAIGFEESIIKPSEVFTTVSVLQTKLNSYLEPKSCLCFLNKDTIEELSSELSKNIQVASIDEVEDVSGYNCVVVGLAQNLYTYDQLNKAFQVLKNGGTLIAMHKARYIAGKEGGHNLGPGAFISGLEYSSCVQAQVIGKPSSEFFYEVLGVSDQSEIKENCFMVGDCVYDDIESAQKLGIKGILVRTGKYKTGNEDKISSKPYKTVNSFDEAVDVIIKSLE